MNNQVGGLQRGGKIELIPEVKRMIAHQIKLGAIKEGERVFVKVAGDGFNVARRDVATAHTVTISNGEKALQIATIALVNAGESYQANMLYEYLDCAFKMK